jgi:hypothetical protein
VSSASSPCAARSRSARLIGKFIAPRRLAVAALMQARIQNSAYVENR